MTNQSPAPGAGSSDAPSFASPLTVALWLLRYRLLLVGAALVGGALGFGAGMVLPPWYEASARLAVIPIDDPTAAGSANTVEGASAALPLLTAVLESHALQDEIIEQLDLVGAYHRAGSPEQARLRLQGRLSILADRKTNLLQLKVSDRDPQRAQKIASLLAERGVQRNSELWTAHSREQRIRLEARMVEITAALTAAEGALQKFRDEHGVADLREQVNASVAQAASLERLLIDKRLGLGISRNFASTAATEVKRGSAELSGVEEELATLGKGKPVAPLLPLSAIPGLEREHARLAREVEVNATRYDLVARQVEQLRSIESRPNGRAVLVDPPSLPTRPSSPRKVLLALEGAFGLALLLSLLLLARGAGLLGRGAAAPVLPTSPPGPGRP